MKREWSTMKLSKLKRDGWNNGENVDSLNFNDENRTIRASGYMNILSFTLLMIVDYKKLKRSKKNEK